MLLPARPRAPARRTHARALDPDRVRAIPKTHEPARRADDLGLTRRRRAHTEQRGRDKARDVRAPTGADTDKQARAVRSSAAP